MLSGLIQSTSSVEDTAVRDVNFAGTRVDILVSVVFARFPFLESSHLLHRQQHIYVLGSFFLLSVFLPIFFFCFFTPRFVLERHLQSFP